MTATLKIFITAALFTFMVTAIEPSCSHYFKAEPIKLVANNRSKEVSSAKVNPEAISSVEAADTLMYFDEDVYDLLPMSSSQIEVGGFRQNSTLTDTESASVFQSDSKVGNPQKLTWKQLKRVAFRLVYDEVLDESVYVPVFSKKLRSLEGELVEIEGFVIPYDPGIPDFALSANSFASCFFCGKASPASVMTVKLAKRLANFKTDEFLKFRGRLLLNSDDPEEFYFILEDAQLLS